MNAQSVDVVVIGAGASGLIAAHKLISSHSINNVIVLEANDRVGGRLYSVSLPTADGVDQWDMGGQWVGSSQTMIMQLLQEFGIEVYPQYMKGRNKMIVKNLTDIRSYAGLIPKLGILELLDTQNIMRKVSSMVSEIPLDNPLKCKNANVWDQITLYTFLEENCFFQASRQMFSLVLKTVFGCEPSQMSLFFMLYYCALSGGFETLLETSKGAAQEFRVKGTIYNLFKKLEKAMGKDRVICGDPVVVVEQDSNTGVLVKTEQGRVYHAKHVICAIPPHLVDRIRFEPPLPHYRQQLSQRMPMGNMIKCLAVYRTPFWREMGNSGQAVMLCKEFETGPLCVTFDATTSNGSPALLGFIAGNHGIYWSRKTKEERKEAILKCFVALFGEQARTELVTYDDKDWSEEKYVGGCPAGLMQPGCLVYFEHVLRKPFGRVHWAGTETARRWMGYVEGAVEAGQRAAGEVAACIESKQMVVSPTDDIPSSVFKQSIPEKRSRFCSVLLLSAAVGCTSYFLYRKYHSV